MIQDRNIHNSNVISQFSKQAVHYTAVEAHYDALDFCVEMSRLSDEDTVLDLACGSGVVSCAFAKHAKHVTGVDITEMMLLQAQNLQFNKGLSNITWVLDDVLPLKFEDESFSLVVTRFSFHHFLEPEKVFAEMLRVCRPGGRVMVIDVALPSEKVEAYDRMELIRDSSHVGALTLGRFEDLFKNSGLINIRRSNYRMEIDLETQLNASALSLEERAILREMIVTDVKSDCLGVDVQQNDTQYSLRYPIYIYVGEKI